MTQAKYHVLREYANGVMDERNRFFPFKIKIFTASGSLPAMFNKTYFVRRITQNASNSGAVAGAVDKVEGTINNVTSVISQVTTPTTFAASQEGIVSDQEISILVDLHTPLTVTIASTSPRVIITYAEVDEVTGEYVR